MSSILQLVRFGNPVLRKAARQVTLSQLRSSALHTLIADMRYTLYEKEYGVGLAAPQVGRNLAISVIGIKPNKNRPYITPFELTIVNPEITQGFGDLAPEWEGCMSCGSGNDILFAQVPRYKKIKLQWLDQSGKRKEETFEGFIAHVIQHEVDHLRGILFVDRVVDSRTYMMADEYRKRIPQKKET